MSLFRHFAIPMAATVGFSTTSANADLKSVKAKEAVAIFLDVCGKTLPNFKAAHKRAAALGFPFEQKNPTKDLSIAVVHSPDGSASCSIRFGTYESALDMRRALWKLGNLSNAGPNAAQGPFGDTGFDVTVSAEDDPASPRIRIYLWLGKPWQKP